MIEWGNIEVIDGNNNMGLPINSLFPLTVDGTIASQIKGRCGVQLGAKLADLKDDNGDILSGFRGRWNGTSNTGKQVEVRIWETSAGA